MGEIDPVFDPQKCPVEVVQRIPAGAQVIENCDIPPSPQPIFDCPDFDLPIPPPIRPPGGGPPCPQFEIFDTIVFPGPEFALTLDILLTNDGPTPEDPDEPCKYDVFLTFEFPVLPPTIEVPCPQFEVTSTIECTVGPCSVDVSITPVTDTFQLPCCGGQQTQQQVQAQACKYQMKFQFQVPQGPEGPQGPPGSKTAIVPIVTANGQEEYLGLFCTEMPESIFMDIVPVRVTGYQSEAMIDHRFLGACEKRSIRVVSVVPVEPVAVGAQVVDDKAVVKIPGFQRCPEVTVMVAGRRAGATERFPQFTKDQMKRNNRFWDSATREQ